ncbi:MAG: DUF971 domain-containing protein [Armatimonadetes bacterium]|nr:DUF971 domain-containing protein [Armatimonadota bacterium]
MTNAATQVVSADLNDAATELEVVWGDRHGSRYPLKLLRGECPCASCRTEREDAKRNPFHMLGPEIRPASFELGDVEPVGGYGLRFIWKDGHSTGIYTFDYLREICPCEDCRAGRKQDEVPYVHGIFIPG